MIVRLPDGGSEQSAVHDAWLEGFSYGLLHRTVLQLLPMEEFATAMREQGGEPFLQGARAAMAGPQ